MFPYTLDSQKGVLHAAIMILWLVTLPAFQIISSVSVVVNVICLVVPATACVLILVLLKPL